MGTDGWCLSMQKYYHVLLLGSFPGSCAGSGNEATCIVMHCIVMHCTVMHCIVMHCIVMHCDD